MGWVPQCDLGGGVFGFSPVDIGTVEIVAGIGLDGGGFMSASPITIDVDVTNITQATNVQPTDLLIIHDDSANLTRSVTVANLLAGGGIGVSDFVSLTDTPSTLSGSSLQTVRVNAAETQLEFYDIDHDSLLNFVSAEHINHNTVSIIAGIGLLGGGTIESNKTINIDVATGTDVASGTSNKILDAALVLDEDNMISDSDQNLATQQSIKAYVDSVSGGGGSTLKSHTTTSSSYTLSTNLEIILYCDCSSNNITVNVPSASSNLDKFFYIKKIDSSDNEVIVDLNGSETLDGNLTKTITDQNVSITVHSDGTDWYII